MHLSANNLHLKFSAPVWRRVAAFWSWWLSELGGMLPARVRRALVPRAQRLFLEVYGPELVMSLGTLHNKAEVARHTLEGTEAVSVESSADETLHQRAREVVLCLPRDKVLTKSLTLPLAAEENLREVLSFEMDRKTPFAAEQVYYDFSVVARSPAERTLTVELVLTTRRVLDDLLVKLDGLGLRPDRVTMVRSDGARLAALNLLPVEHRQRKAVTPRLVNLALAVLALMLVIAVLSLPLIDKRQRIQALEPLLEAASAKADQARQLRKEIDLLTANARFLTDKKQSWLPVLEVMDELTRILPDDTWITRLDIKGSELQIQGQSASAAALIPLIESSSVLQNPGFRSPVTQVPRSDLERFHLSAGIRGSTP